jgi:hypothetical protein
VLAVRIHVPLRFLVVARQLGILVVLLEGGLLPLDLAFERRDTVTELAFPRRAGLDGRIGRRIACRLEVGMRLGELVLEAFEMPVQRRSIVVGRLEGLLGVGVAGEGLGELSFEVSRRCVRLRGGRFERFKLRRRLRADGGRRVGCRDE